MTRTVAQKMGIKAHSKTLFVDAPIDVIEGIHLPEIDSTEKLAGEFDYIIYLLKNRKSSENNF